LEEAARRLHAEGTDVVVDATGQAEMLELGLRVARFGGVLVLAGYFGGAEVRVRPDTIGERNLRVLGAGNNSGFIGAAARAAAEGTLRTESMITHRFHIEDWATFLDPSFINRDGLIKAIIRRSE
jgi:L-iditol 2-dehydrogenase